MYSKQINKLWRSLCTPLDAVTYTNEFLIVSGAVATFMVLLLASFAGNIDVMSDAIGKINEKKQEILNEKIDIISAEKSGNTAIIILTNYGIYDTEILAFFSDVSQGQELTCRSNNVPNTDMTVVAAELLEVTCDLLHPSASKILAVTSTRNILESKLD